MRPASVPAFASPLFDKTREAPAGPSGISSVEHLLSAPDHYAALHLPRLAKVGREDLRAAYKQLALRVHPDKTDERDAALRSRSKLRAEVHAERVRGIEGRAEVAAALVLGSNHWQRECEKMCNLLGQAEERAEFFETRTKCLLRAADIGGAGVVNVSTQAISCCLW